MNGYIVSGDIYPLGMSKSGNNAYYLKGCEDAGRVPSYASCLHKIDRVAKGDNLIELDQDCVSAISKGRCQALSMKREEEVEGVSLYYIPRPKTDGEAVVKVKNFDENCVCVNTLKKGDTGLKNAIINTDVNLYAEAINQMMKEKVRE